MTKEEFLELRDHCDKVMSNYLGMPCTVDVVLPDKLDVIFDYGCRVVWNVVRGEVHYIAYIGFYSNFVDEIDKIRNCVDDNRNEFDKLLWVYDHRDEFDWMRVVIETICGPSEGSTDESK